MKFILSLLLLILGSMLMAQPSGPTVDITVKFNQLEQNKGKIFVQLFDQEQNVYTGKTVEVRVNFTQITFHQVPAGNYAVRAFHDVNSNGEMDANWMGIPKEPYGFSNNVRGSFGPPDFEDQLFRADGNTVIEIILEN